MDNTYNISKTPAKIHWHPAFLQAIKQELFDYRDSLEYKYEYQLTAEPLRIDLLIIKKPKDLAIQKNIARIFRTDNLLEYKSPKDKLSVKDFLKVYAYANLYAAITPHVELADITITFIENRHPRKLIAYLTDIRGYKVEEPFPGIYLVTGDYIPMQIIETKKLSERENLWLKSLTNDLEIPHLNDILERSSQNEQALSLDAYFNVLIHANPEVFLEVLKMNTATFEEVFTKAGIIPQWIERGIERGIKQEKEKTALNLLARGIPIDEVAHITELPVEKIHALVLK